MGAKREGRKKFYALLTVVCLIVLAGAFFYKRYRPASTQDAELSSASTLTDSTGDVGNLSADSTQALPESSQTESPSSPTAKDYYEAGVKSFNTKNYSEAINSFNQAIGLIQKVPE